MEQTNSKRAVIIGVAVIAIVAVVVIFLAVRGRQSAGPAGAPGNNAGVAGGGAAPATTTRLPVPASAVVPEAGATNAPSGVAVPQVETTAAPGVDAKYRSFNVTVQNGEFTPSTIAVHLGDTVNLQIGAVGGDYDFTQPDFGLKASLPKGANKKVQFAAMATGKFTFYCSLCGGPAKGPVGYIIVVGK